MTQPSKQALQLLLNQSPLTGPTFIKDWAVVDTTTKKVIHPLVSITKHEADQHNEDLRSRQSPLRYVPLRKAHRGKLAEHLADSAVDLH